MSESTVSERARRAAAASITLLKRAQELNAPVLIVDIAGIVEREFPAYDRMVDLLRTMTQRPIPIRVLIQAGNEARELLKRLEGK